MKNSILYPASDFAIQMRKSLLFAYILACGQWSGALWKTLIEYQSTGVSTVLSNHFSKENFDFNLTIEAELQSSYMSY